MTPEYELIFELRNALAAAMRVLVQKENAVDNFLSEARQSGVKDGVGKRADEWLRKNNSP